MKQKAKQRAWAAKQAASYIMKKRKNLALIMMGFIITLISFSFIAEQSSAKNTSFKDVVNSGIFMLMATNIPEATPDEKAPRQIKHKIHILWDSQVDKDQVFPSRVGRDVGTIPLKAGEYWHWIEIITEPKFLSSLSGDLASVFDNKPEIQVGGMSDDLLNMLEDNRGAKCYIVFEICKSGKKFLGGNKCQPLKFIGCEGGFGDDYTGFTLSFQNMCGEMWSNYTGTLQTQAPSVVAEDATVIPLVSNAAYQLTTGSADAKVITSLSGVTDADVNRVITVYGSGGTYPSTIPAGNDFLLISGSTWTANAGKQISFKIFKDGAGSYKFMEVAGTRTE